MVPNSPEAETALKKLSEVKRSSLNLPHNFDLTNMTGYVLFFELIT